MLYGWLSDALRNSTTKIKEAMSHIDFALHMCAVQAKAGRYFLFEHLVQAKSWSLSRVRHVFKYKNVTTVDF